MGWRGRDIEWRGSERQVGECERDRMAREGEVERDRMARKREIGWQEREPISSHGCYRATKEAYMRPIHHIGLLQRGARRGDSALKKESSEGERDRMAREGDGMARDREMGWRGRER